MEACIPNMISFGDAYIFVIGGTRSKYLSSYRATDSHGCCYGFEGCDCDDKRRNWTPQSFLTDQKYVDYYDLVKDVWKEAPVLKVLGDSSTSCVLKDFIYTFLIISYRQNQRIKRLNARAVVDDCSD